MHRCKGHGLGFKAWYLGSKDLRFKGLGSGLTAGGCFPCSKDFRKFVAVSRQSCWMMNGAGAHFTEVQLQLYMSRVVSCRLGISLCHCLGTVM